MSSHLPSAATNSEQHLKASWASEYELDDDISAITTSSTRGHTSVGMMTNNNNNNNTTMIMTTHEQDLAREVSPSIGSMVHHQQLHHSSIIDDGLEQGTITEEPRKSRRNVPSFKFLLGRNTSSSGQDDHLEGAGNKNMNIPTNNANESSLPFSKNEKNHSLNSIRVKTLTILLFMFLLTVLICFAILIVAFHISYSRIEHTTLLQSSLRVLRGIHENFYYLHAKLLEYAPWEETAKLFMPNVGNVDQYFSNNFYCSYMASVKLSFVSLYFLNGTKLRSYACYNSTLEEDIPIELEVLNSDHYFVKDMNVSTTRRAAFMRPSSTSVNHPNEFIMMVAMPVLTMDTDTQSYGIMIFGMYQSSSFIQDLTAKTQVCISFYDLNSTIGMQVAHAMTGYSSDTSSISSYSGLSINALNTTWLLQNFFYIGTFDSSSSVLTSDRYCDTSGSASIAGVLEEESIYGERMSSLQILQDVNRENTIMLRADISRNIYLNGINSFLITWGVMTAMLILLSVSVIVFVELVVLRRMIKLTNGVIQITGEWQNDSNAVTKGVKLPKFGKDEIGKLGMRVNYMLSVLEKSFIQLQKEHALAQSLLDRTSIEEQKYRNVMNGITDFIITVECATGKIINYNSSFESKVIGKIRDENSEKNVQNKIIHEYFEGMTLETLLKKLEELSQESGVQVWEGVIRSRFRSTVPVNVTCSKVKIVVQDGDIIDAYVMMARNMSEQHELKKTLLSQQQQFSEQQQSFEFDYYWKNREMRNRLRVFCMNEKSYENFKFLEEIETYKKMKRTQQRSKKQQEIIEQFLTKDSKYELNLSQDETFTLVSKIKNGYGQVDLFDKLQVVVRNMLYRDTFQRFLLEIAKENDETTTSSTSLDLGDDSTDTVSSSSLVD
ncbi:hypothetical protein C9374_005789 [Naegleria lovaniensis]|uniref:RGS domain-containing protein n=1 Tax=Naegleria lovaniensis TaxID=51637 RepID=A0AA88GPG9_NAELO|nr:uncharacterized protein C9374_005789 [Naegleria lovaniensis]KAG2381997.1 hypothetical protein C9374_005789 [Naegleria lovaniensis]